MGIYIIKSIHSDWIKVGHHKITSKRPSVYYRYFNRGFYSCICPYEIQDKVGFKDLKLMYWFENLDINDEKNLHKHLKKLCQKKLCLQIGEWYKYEMINYIINMIYKDYNGILKIPTDNEYDEALNWAKRWGFNSQRLKC